MKTVIGCILLVLSYCSGCTPICSVPGMNVESSKRIFLVNHGYHSGIVLSASDIDSSLLPEIVDFPAAHFVEFGWGDRAYYMLPDASVLAALRALFIPSNSVLHVVSFATEPEIFFDRAKVTKITISEGAFDSLLAYISGTFERHANEKSTALAEGLYGESKFYAARGDFHLFNTCNHWVQRGLRIVGC